MEIDDRGGVDGMSSQYRWFNRDFAAAQEGSQYFRNARCGHIRARFMHEAQSRWRGAAQRRLQTLPQ